MNRTILIVDQCAATQGLLGRSLMEEGFRTVVADDAATAWRLLESESIGMIILDLVLPKISGMNFLKAVRSRAEWHPLPALVVTNSTDKALHQRALELGAIAVVPKNNAMSDRVVAEVRMAIAVNPTSMDIGSNQSLIF